MQAAPTPVGAACTVNSRNPLQRRRAISMLSPPDERDKMRTHPNCHNCHRLPPTVTNTHGKTPTRTAKAPTRTAKSPARTAKTPARSGAECGVKAISAIGCAAQLAEQHKTPARARKHRGRTRAQWPQHPGPSSPRKSQVCDCRHTQCSNTRPRAGRTLAERRPNAARCHDFARADSARASRARQRRARQRRARQ